LYCWSTTNSITRKQVDVDGSFVYGDGTGVGPTEGRSDNACFGTTVGTTAMVGRSVREADGIGVGPTDGRSDDACVGDCTDA
jgi:hypothetical protein